MPRRLFVCLFFGWLVGCHETYITALRRNCRDSGCESLWWLDLYEYFCFASAAKSYLGFTSWVWPTPWLKYCSFSHFYCARLQIFASVLGGILCLISPVCLWRLLGLYLFTICSKIITLAVCPCIYLCVYMCVNMSW